MSESPEEKPWRRLTPVEKKRVVENIANGFLEQQDLRGFRYELVDARRSEIHLEQWNVIYDIHSPSGGLFDGGAIVVVDEILKTAWFFPSL